MRRMQWGSSLWPFQHHDCLPPRDLSLEGNGPPAGRHAAFTSAEGTKSPLVKHASQVNAPPLNWSSQWTLTIKHTNATCDKSFEFPVQAQGCTVERTCLCQVPGSPSLSNVSGSCMWVTLRDTNAHRQDFISPMGYKLPKSQFGKDFFFFLARCGGTHL